MNNWIDRLERRYSRFAIPYLVNGLMVGQLAAGLIVLLISFCCLAPTIFCTGRSGGSSRFCSSLCGWVARWAS